MRALFVSISVLSTSFLFAQETEQHIATGNTMYRNKQYKESEEEYKKALEKTPGQPVANYNYASSLYRNKKDGQASNIFDSLAKTGTNTKIRSQSYYNSGAILSRDYELTKEASTKIGPNAGMLNSVNTSILVKSIDAYKNALRQNPADSQARENLQKALIELKKQQPPPEKKQDQKKKQEEKKKEQQRPKMNQKEVEQRLKLMEQKEKEVQQRVQKQKVKSSGSVPKDW